jgi:hypothetical protein
MSGAVPPLPQYAFMSWCSVKAQGQLYLYQKEDVTMWVKAQRGKVQTSGNGTKIQKN